MPSTGKFIAGKDFGYQFKLCKNQQENSVSMSSYTKIVFEIEYKLKWNEKKQPEMTNKH